MASISTNKKNGRRTLEFVDAGRKRRYVRLGKLTMKAAENVKIYVERLVTAQIAGDVPDSETARWLAGIDDTLREKLANVGLVERRLSATLAAFVDQYITDRRDVKGSTSTVYRRTQKHLLSFFGENRPLRDITVGDAKDFRRYLQQQPGRGAKGADGKRPRMAEDTIRRTCGIAKQLMEDAIDRGLIERNPFKHRKIPTATGASDKSREFFISRELAGQVIEALPDAEWRLMFALARYGGLRCPSEVLSLRWGDIDWDRERIIVTSPKTEHHEGQGSRVIPLFPELWPFLDERLSERELELDNPDVAVPLSEPVITRYRKSDSNYGVLLGKIVRRAGLTMWPKPWQNLRSTRETELAEQFPMHVVCEWIGNSQVVAAKHYLQVTDDHFSAAIGKVAPQKVAETATQRPASAPMAEVPEHEKTPDLQGFAADCDELQEFDETDPMGVTGLEPVTSSV